MFGPAGQFDTGAIFEPLDSFVQTHLEIAAVLIVALGALALVVHTTIRFKWLMGMCLVEASEGVDEIAVLMYPNPDPDAMAATIGVAYLAEQVDTVPTIQFVSQIRHQENHVLRIVLDLDLGPVDHVNDLAAEAVVLIGHNEPHGFAGAGGTLPYAAADHHPGDGTSEAFTDIRTDYDACSSIIAEYLHGVGAKLAPSGMHASEVNASYTVPSQITTGLVYGTLTDTKYFTAGCSTADFDATGFLFPGVNEDHLDRVAGPEVSHEVLETKIWATAGRDVRGSFAVADIGTISNVDTILQAADKLVQLGSVTAAVVCGEHESNVYLSGRSRDDRVHMGRALEVALSYHRRSNAGGRARMGGG